MLRSILLTALLATVCQAQAGDTIRIGSRVLSVGDSTGTVMKVIGAPSRTVQIESQYGGAVAERWEYYRDGKTILITVRDGRVVGIDQLDS